MFPDFTSDFLDGTENHRPMESLHNTENLRNSYLNHTVFQTVKNRRVLTVSSLSLAPKSGKSIAKMVSERDTHAADADNLCYSSLFQAFSKLGAARKRTNFSVAFPSDPSGKSLSRFL